MKALRTILAFAACAAALALTGCNKDNDSDGAPENKLIFGENTYDLTPNVCYYIEEGGHIQGEASYHLDFEVGSIAHGFPTLSASCVGKTVDLTKYDASIQYIFEINSHADWVIDVHQYNMHYGDVKEFAGHLYDHPHADGSVFKSGTMKLTVANNKATLKVNAVLNDGKDFKLNVTIPIETLE